MERCFCCRRPTARTALIDGQRVPLCERCPTPAQIRQRCREVQANWTVVREATRRFGCRSDQVDNVQAIFIDTPVHIATERRR